MVSREWSADALVIADMMFGFSLWILNCYVIAPLAGWVVAVTGQQSCDPVRWHVFFFGGPVGRFLARSQA
jgi:hypothetical protein